MFMTMSWIFGSAILVKSIVYEKEQRLKETMKVTISTLLTTLLLFQSYQISETIDKELEFHQSKLEIQFAGYGLNQWCILDGLVHR